MKKIVKLKTLAFIYLLLVLFSINLSVGYAEKNSATLDKNKNSSDKKTLVVGFGPSTYVNQFDESIKPQLEQLGYHVKTRIFSQNSQINPAMKEGAIDASVFQSEAYMEEVNELLNLTMMKLADTASAPQSLRSKRHDALEDVKDGMTIVMPNDPVNAERAARILEQLGWITIPEDADIARFNTKLIKPAAYKLKFIELDSAQSLRALDDVDFAIVNGNYVANSGEKISAGLVVEETPAQHVVIVTIRQEDETSRWAKDLKAAYESKEFEDYIKTNELYDGFILPQVWRR